jgi:hypothetical protein
MMPAIAALIGPHLASRLGCKFHDDIGSDLNGMSPAFAIHPQHIGTGGVTYRLELHQPTFQVLILRVGHPILNGRIEARKLAIGVGGFLANLKAPIDLIDAALALVGMPENTLDEIALKRNAFERLHSGPHWLNLKIASDCYIAAFFLQKIGGTPSSVELGRPSVPLTDHVWAAVRGQTVHGPLVGIADKIANEIAAFHWQIEFPHIFSRGGFDVVIGNPPWERIKLQDEPTRPRWKKAAALRRFNSANTGASDASPGHVVPAEVA